MTFTDIFKPIAPTEITDNVFTLVGEVFPVVTVGDATDYNSMTASGGGLVLMFRKPATLLLFPRKRYTLELIEQKKTYTLSYFPDEFRPQVMLLGTKSGRDSDKMREVDLTAVALPSGNMSFAEARLIIECDLLQITTPTFPDDFFAQDAIDYMAEPYKDPDEHRKYVFGTITSVWTRK